MKKSIYAIVLFTHQRGTNHVKVYQRERERSTARRENRIHVERFELKLKSNVNQLIRLHKYGIYIHYVYTDKQGELSLIKQQQQKIRRH